MDKVTSRDGTTIAFDRYGAGPPVILVGGAFNDRMTAAPLAAALAADLTAFAYDRRGRGASGDTLPYAVDREVEDIGALIAAAGGEAFVFGHSSGAALTIEAVAQGLPISKIALFEPPFLTDDTHEPPPPDLATRYTELSAAGRRREAVELFMTRIGTPPQIIEKMQGQPMWAGLETIAHTLAYDATIMGDGSMPADRVAAVTVPTLLVDSTASPTWLRQGATVVTATIPGAQRRSLAGKAHDVPPEIFAPVLAEFFLGTAYPHRPPSP